MDYGQAILLDNGYFPRTAYFNGPIVKHSAADPSVLDLWGVGWGFTVNIGSHLDGRFSMGFPLTNPGIVHGWSTMEYIHYYFAVGAQF